MDSSMVVASVELNTSLDIVAIFINKDIIFKNYFSFFPVFNLIILMIRLARTTLIMVPI